MSSNYNSGKPSQQNPSYLNNKGFVLILVLTPSLLLLTYFYAQRRFDSIKSICELNYSYLTNINNRQLQNQQSRLNGAESKVSI